jgi:hypothetical protein
MREGTGSVGASPPLRLSDDKPHNKWCCPPQSTFDPSLPTLHFQYGKSARWDLYEGCRAQKKRTPRPPGEGQRRGRRHGVPPAQKNRHYLTPSPSPDQGRANQVTNPRQSNPTNSQLFHDMSPSIRLKPDFLLTENHYHDRPLDVY